MILCGLVSFVGSRIGTGAKCASGAEEKGEGKWDRFVKIVAGEKIQTITLVRVVYLQILKRKRYGIVMDIINHATIM